ncbi:hypothetical protein W59_02446 [Rhodococcus opacus RKJ300 = JCM 13270]|uniref:Phage integrase family protein n=1 Tax=Rhodococcus opacus RKJ300 = JCM 13270 TaxID=1165867 RepID=I0WYW2_RHOOP|nr:hypothetical protein W59_02446 [Rhodococcus opacus RKJ300 = JCM 13270]
MGVGSLLEVDTTNMKWSRRVGTVNRIVQRMRTDIDPIHNSRSDTRELGYLDTNYWGFRFPDRRSVFDLTSIGQRWLRDLTWDYLAERLDEPNRPRTQGTFEQLRRSIVCFSTYLTDCDPDRGQQPAALTRATAQDFVADFTRRVANQEPCRGVFNKDGTASTATNLSYSMTLNALRRVMRAAMDGGTAAAIGLPREFIVALPFGGTTAVRNPRPFSDEVLRALSDPVNIALLRDMDPHDGGLADIWSIQVRCGRRISEIVKLRWDCVSEHLGRTWLWVDMTKVGKLDYAIQIPRDVYELIGTRQAKTERRYRLKHGTDPTTTQRHRIALFPSRVSNPTFERSLCSSTFTAAFKAWIESDTMQGPRTHHPSGPSYPRHPPRSGRGQHDPRQTRPRSGLRADGRVLRAHRRVAGRTLPATGVGDRPRRRPVRRGCAHPLRHRGGFRPTTARRPGRDPHRTRPVHLQTGCRRLRLPVRPQLPFLRAFRADRRRLRVLETAGTTLGHPRRRGPRRARPRLHLHHLRQELPSTGRAGKSTAGPWTTRPSQGSRPA